MATRIWYDLCRKYVKSELAGRALMAETACLEVMQRCSEAAVNRQRYDGVVLTDAHCGEPRLVVNLKREGYMAEYTHYIEMLTTALMHDEEPAHE